MKKKLLTLFMTITLSVSLVACGESSNEATKNNETKKEEKKKPTDLTGTWKSEENNGAWMEAVISDSVIEINWVADEGKTKSIYWVGTYDAPTEYTEEYKWISERDKEKTDMALMASTDDTKEFTYENKKINYEASALGSTTTVELTKK